MTVVSQRRALFAGLALLALLGCSGGDTDGSGIAASWPGSVALRPVLPGVRAEGAARLVGHGRGARLELRVRGLPALEDAYEVWLFNSVADAVGLARVVRGSFALRVRLPVRPSRYRYLDISREPFDGNANHSGVSVMRVPVSRLLDARP